MERSTRAFARFTLFTILASTSVGCRGVHPEVPPRRAFRNDGSLEEAPPVKFSTDGRAVPGNAATGSPYGESPAARPGFGSRAPERMARPSAPTGLGEPPSLEVPPAQPLDEPAGLGGGPERPRGVMGSSDAPPSPL